MLYAINLDTAGGLSVASLARADHNYIRWVLAGVEDAAEVVACGWQVKRYMVSASSGAATVSLPCVILTSRVRR